MATNFRKVIKSFSGNITTARQNATNAAQSLVERTKVVTRNFNVPRSNSRTENGSKFDLAGPAELDDEPIYPSMQEMWKADIYDLPVCKDLPRLARRVVVEDGKGNVIHEPPAKLDEGGGAIDAFQPVKQLLLLLCQKIEPNRYVELKQQLDAIEDDLNSATDLQMVMEQIIPILGENGRVTKVLKTIHQNIVLHCTFELRKHITKNRLTKDVRSSDGWRIVITLADFVQVRHTRREQSIDEFGNTDNHWEFEWELRMTFTSSMREMTAAQLRVLSLELSETMDPALASELRNTIVDNLIVM